MPCLEMTSPRSATTPRTGAPSMCRPTSAADSLTKPTTCVSEAAVRQMCPARATAGPPAPTPAAPPPLRRRGPRPPDVPGERHAGLPRPHDGRPRPAADLPQGELVEHVRVEPHGHGRHGGEDRGQNGPGERR